MTLDGNRTNWGRWGADDERGALNLVSPARIAMAAARVTTGTLHVLGTSVDRHGPLAPGRNATWRVVTQATDPADPGRGRAEDVLVMHSHAHSHIDALSHVWHGGHLYNGVPAKAVSRAGTRHAAVDRIGAIVGTGVILDVAATRPLGAGDAVTAADLEAEFARTGLAPADADVFLVRTGWTSVHRSDPAAYLAGEPGLAPDAVEWIAERDAVAVGMDNWGIEPVPSPAGTRPLHCHERLLCDLGIYLFEGLDLDAAVAAGVRVGMFVASPLLIRRGTGSPVNPVLIS